MTPPISDTELLACALGDLPAARMREIEAAAAADAALHARLVELRAQLARKAAQQAQAPAPGLKARLFQRPELQQSPTAPPILHSRSRLETYAPWLGDSLEKIRAAQDDFTCISLAFHADTATFLVRMCTDLPQEVHTDLIERILVLEGSCEFREGERSLNLGTGDVYTIPLHTPHAARNTGDIPCIFLLQRTQV